VKRWQAELNRKGPQEDCMVNG